jgi:hypothetical protein
MSVYFISKDNAQIFAIQVRVARLFLLPQSIMVSAQQAKRLARDTFSLSSLFFRRVLLTKPATLDAYREKTRELLLSQSRLSAAGSGASPASDEANVAAMKLLEWDKEWNLMRYYGFREYGRRWWNSRSSGSSRAITNRTESMSSKKSAQIAFMITSEQRRLLGDLGYTPDDIKSFKPIEALLLVKNSLRKYCDVPDYNFRDKLNVLIDENDELMKAEQKVKRDKVVDQDINKVDKPSAQESNSRTLTPEEVQHAQVKPDVALALMSTKSDDEGTYQSAPAGDESVEKVNQNEQSTLDESTTKSSTTTHFNSYARTPPKHEHVVKPIESEQLHMKPDVAAAYLNSQQSDKPHQTDVDLDVDEESIEPCWYEVIEVNNSCGKEQIIALFSTKKEAAECARIKESFRARGNKKLEIASTFIVRRRWNV